MRKILGKVISAATVMMLALGLVAPVSGLAPSGEAHAESAVYYGTMVNNALTDGGGGGGPSDGGGGSGGGEYNPDNEGVSKKDVETSILPSDWGIENILKLILNILVYGLGAAATLGVIIAGIMYMTARDNEAQVAKAKTRLYEVVVGLVAWALMYAVLNWLIPGGINF